MSDKRARRWFQFHLSTAVLMMLVVGAMSWLEMHEHRFKLQVIGDNEGPYPEYIVMRGWPVMMGRETIDKNGIVTELPWSTEATVLGYFTLDLLCFLSILAATGFVSEYIIRRRETKKL